MKKCFFPILVTFVTLLIACQENERPVPMQVEINGQVEIFGNKANIVRPDTMALVIVRDSVADEKTDTIYHLKTSLTFVLDSTFMADKMEEALQLHINDITFVPTDSACANSLIAFLKSDVGTKTVVEFTGKTERSKFLQLSNAVKVSLIGFSFHELDPEAMADPKITKLIDSYEKWINILNNAKKENYGMLPQMYVYEGLPEAYGLYKKLAAHESVMSPKQKERFANLLRIHKSIDFPE